MVVNGHGSSGGIFWVSLFLFFVFCLAVPFIGFSKDFLNYFNELSSGGTIDRDFFSWAILRVFFAYFSFSQSSFILFGLLIGVLTASVIALRFGRFGFACWVTSILFVFYPLYLNQVRLALALLAVVIVVGRSRFSVAALFSTGFHATAPIIFYPLSYLLVFGLAYIFLSDQLPQVVWHYMRVSSEISWYFGVEIFIFGAWIAFRKVTYKTVVFACRLILFFLIVRVLALEISLDLARRVMELIVLSFSPFIYFIRGIRVTRLHLLIFAVLGSMQSLVYFLENV